MKNRLHLDWTLDSAIDRADFVQSYINELKNPSEEELETIANYLLWGKDENGLGPKEKGDIEIETKNKTWTRDNVDSLDEMMESPTFNEASLQSCVAPTRIKRETFSRSRALEECPEPMRETFKSLFSQIDELDLSISLYELAHGKRSKPPREELLQNFSEDQLAAITERVSHWNQFSYLKRRHLLVELRREQFTLKDIYSQPVMRRCPPEPAEPELPSEFNSEIPVFPLGVLNSDSISSILFKPKSELNPKTYSKKDLEKLSKFLWRKKSEARPQFFFDFTSLENVYSLFQQLSELDGVELNQNTSFLIKTLFYYLEFAELNEVQKEILDLKVKKMKNQDIADFVNKKYGKSYTANYISTIFRQKIIPKINAAAEFHLRILENMFFEEEFKQCTCCGTWLLRDPELFVRKTRARDGLSNRCKKCDKIERQSKKEK